MKYQYIAIILVSTFFGFISGIAGFLAFRTYLIGSEFNLPFLTDINLTADNTGGASIVISNPKNIVIEQNTKVRETQEAVSKSILAIYKQDQETATTSILARGENLIGLDSEAGQAFVVTSDGWLISSFVPEELVGAAKMATSAKLSKLGLVREKYLVLDKDRKAYPVEDVLLDEELGFSFWKVEARDLSVRKFAPLSEIHNGQMVVSLAWDGRVGLTTVENRRKLEEARISRSDYFNLEVGLADEAGKDFSGSFLANLYGDLVAIYDQQGAAVPIEVLAPDIDSILNNKTIVKPGLGIEYIDLSRFFLPGLEIDKGAYVVSHKRLLSAPKEVTESRLEPGDIVLSVNGLELDAETSLSKAVAGLKPGREALLSVLRENESLEIELVVGVR